MAVSLGHRLKHNDKQPRSINMRQIIQIRLRGVFIFELLSTYSPSTATTVILDYTGGSCKQEENVSISVKQKCCFYFIC